MNDDHDKEALILRWNKIQFDWVTSLHYEGSNTFLVANSYNLSNFMFPQKNWQFRLQFVINQY
jgi:hypothetical protein